MNPKTAQHTPTPLIDLYDGGDEPKTAQFLVDRLGISQAKAAFIVRAVNAHGELVKVLKAMNQVEEAYCICPANDGHLPYEEHATICVMAQKALAKAEAQS